ncbi:Gfo/Idh/MocA family protein [Paucisalibacillus sp. EB02]|uniref:Gfo/Idh/MocA family protein n=1 Tax=Paucisalibacillus sp. EB02 TaxID=1347087 RepID=UPI0004B3EC91|nr:Gfo/Idh/MocA family oxidoreductase [Paucisalibacillus sp. EB02]
MKKVRVAIIGIGAIAESTHLRYLLENESTEVVGLVDMDVIRAEAVAKKNGISHWFRTIEALLENVEVDAVFICTPNSTHIPIAKKAAEKGVHVFIEKPIGIQIEEVEEYIELARAKKVKTMVGMTHRFRREASILKSYIEQGAFGELYYVKAKLFRGRGTPKGWFTNKELSGGGALMDIGVHVLDLSWWLMGCPKVYAISGKTIGALGNYQTKYTNSWASKNSKLNVNHVFDVDDFSAGWIRFRNGAVLNVDVAWAINGEQDEAISIELFGDQGGAKLNPLTIYREENGIVTKTEPHFAKNDVFQDEINHFIDCLLENKEPLIDAEQGLDVLKMLLALYKSSDEEREIVF